MIAGSPGASHNCASVYLARIRIFPGGHHGRPAELVRGPHPCHRERHAVHERRFGFHLVSIWVREDDIIFDELLWETSFTVTSEEVAIGLVDRTFDCSFDLPDVEAGPMWEIYADALVDKDNGPFVDDDSPMTPNLEVEKVEDDTAEDDDSQGTAAILVLDTVLDRIARDDDWFWFTLTDPAELEVKLTFRPGCGRLDATLYPNDDSPVGAADEDDGAKISTGLVGAGSHTILVSPRDTGDFNFYDITVIATIPIFADGFESGDCSKWPVTIGEAP